MTEQRYLVTGAAGFIGSNLCRRLLRDGNSVTGMDCFTDYYPRWMKDKNLDDLIGRERFQLLEQDINETDCRRLLERHDIVYHLAAQAGVRASWGSSFMAYTRYNIEATQRLLEAAKNSPLKKFLYASSSSVYGSCPDLPMSEQSQLYPYSPYGVSKLAAEHLCSLYFRNYGVPTSSFRFFTVYGPGQRPDMAFHKFLKSVLEERPLTVFGDGSQTRDFTYIDDIVEGLISAVSRSMPGEIYNLGGGNRKKLFDVFPILEKVCKKEFRLQSQAQQKGDVTDTCADIRKAREHLGFSPKTSLEEGLELEWKWIRKLYASDENKSTYKA